MKDKERKEKLSDVVVVCTINKICAGENKPQKTLVKNHKNQAQAQRRWGERYQCFCVKSNVVKSRE